MSELGIDAAALNTLLLDDTKETLVGALLIALPYVEDALDSEDFKKGAVQRHVTVIRAALAKAGVQ